jgi:undecaprenyl pyrophosphate phosphatase UppP
VDGARRTTSRPGARRDGERTAISWTTAILVGVAQVVAGVFPGDLAFAATIFVALLAGTTSRVAATEFAFLVGIPTMFAATGYELLSMKPATAALHTRTGARWASPSWPPRSPPSSR